MAGRFPIVLLLAGLLYWGPAGGPDARAQAIEFEQVGDQPIDAEDLEFDSEGALWAGADPLYRLPQGSGFWEEVYDEPGSIGDIVLSISTDTLFLTSSHAVHRSIDAGQIFSSVHSNGGALFASDLDGPNAGVILSGEHLGGTGIAYSTDRGASFSSATFTVSTSSRPFLQTAVEIPDGPAAGRLVAGVFAGIVLSEDGGRTWEPSSLFQNARFWPQRIEIGADPATGDRRLYVVLLDAQLPDMQFYYSDDDGLTWASVPGMVNAYYFVWVPQGEGFLLAVEIGYDIQSERIEVWRSDDGGQTWTDAGHLPADPDGGGIWSEDVLIGPEGHIYVAVSRGGPEREWVYRSTEPVVVASEPEVPPTSSEALAVYPNPAAERLTVEAAPQENEAVLYDVLGRAVLRQRLVAGKAVLDVSRLPAGVYVLRAGAQSRVVTLRR